MKKYITVILASIMTLALTACGKQGNPAALPEQSDTVSVGVSDGTESGYPPNTEEKSSKPVSVTFQATVIEAGNDTITVKPADGSPELNSADKFSIPNIDGLELQIGDLVEIDYNGEIMESYPAQLGEIYKITVAEQTEATSDRIAMVRINGKLYYDTGKESAVTKRCGNMDGQITTAVDGTEIPTEDNQSNFGIGFGYQYGQNGTIEIYMNEKWIVFEFGEESGR